MVPLALQVGLHGIVLQRSNKCLANDGIHDSNDDITEICLLRQNLLLTINIDRPEDFSKTINISAQWFLLKQLADHVYHLLYALFA